MLVCLGGHGVDLIVFLAGLPVFLQDFRHTLVDELIVVVLLLVVEVADDLPSHIEVPKLQAPDDLPDLAVVEQDLLLQHDHQHLEA